MSCVRVAPCLLALFVAGCAGGYALVSPGLVRVGDLSLLTEASWNRVPRSDVPWARKATETWTANGLSLDRMVVIPRVADGESLYLSRGGVEYPLFRTDMDSESLQSLVASTIELAQGANRTEVQTANGREHQFGANAGILFELQASVLDGPEYRGTAGAFIAGERLYLLYFIGAVPHYYDTYIGRARSIIESATL